MEQEYVQASNRQRLILVISETFPQVWNVQKHVIAVTALREKLNYAKSYTKLITIRQKMEIWKLKYLPTLAGQVFGKDMQMNWCYKPVRALTVILSLQRHLLQPSVGHRECICISITEVKVFPL